MSGEANERGEGNAEEFFTGEETVDAYTERSDREELFEQEAEAFERYFTKSGGSVLDIGCGVGRVSHLLDEKGFDVTGIDISEPFVENARSLFPDIEFRVADAIDTPFESESFDYAVFSFYGLDYVLPKSKRIAALREIYRVLKPGGFFVFSSHNLWYLLPDVALADGDYLYDLFLRAKNRDRLFERQKFETVSNGELEIYLTSPLHQLSQLRKCGFTMVDVIGRRDNLLRLFEKNTHYVAKK